MSGKLTHFFRSVIPLLIIICSVSALLHVDYVFADDPKAKVQIVTYSQDIRPLLKKHCVECHSGWFPDGGLRLDSIDAIFKGGNSGPAIVPGSPDKGWLMYSLTKARQRRMQMPPNGERLSQQQVNLLKEWIRQGAN